MSSSSLTTAIAEAAAGTTFEELPPDVVTIAKQCFVDWVGVALAGSAEPVTTILSQELLAQGAQGPCTLLGGDASVAARDAALINGTAGHALDFDDVSGAMSGHPSAPLIPALLALGEQVGASGADIITAFVAGFEAECRIGLAVAPGHYRSGWHATGTVGTFGAAVGCAHLLGLDGAATEVAMGIAAAQASGLKSLFGTMCKPLHAGKAASSGLLAASLARRGFTSIPGVLEVPQGFAATSTDTFSPEAGMPGEAEGYHLSSVLFKYHAACFLTHASIEGVLRAKEEDGFAAGDVRRITLRVPEGHLSVCNIDAPVTALEGKFSLRFTAALALVSGDVSERAFSDAAVCDGDIEAVRRLVEVKPIAGANRYTTETEVELHDGSVHRRTVDMQAPPVNTVEIEAQGRRLVAKHMALANPVLGSETTAELLTAIAGLEALVTVSELTGLCRKKGVAS